MDDAYHVYMAILDKPGMNTNQIAKLFGKKYASWADNLLKTIEDNYGLLTEDEKGGLYVFEG
jgi:hypothetical protein